MKRLLVIGALAAAVSACSHTAPLQIREPGLPGAPVYEHGHPSYKLRMPVADGLAYAEYVKATLALTQGNLREAADHLNVTVSRDPEATLPRMKLVNVLLLLGRRDEASQLMGTLDLDPRRLPGELLSIYVDALISTDRDQDTIEAMKVALKRGALAPMQLLRWVTLAEQRHSPEQLRETILELRELAPDEPIFDCVEGHLLMRSEQYEASIAFLDRCREASPDWLPALLERALVAELTGDAALAQTLYRRVLELQPGQGLASWRLRALTEATTTGQSSSEQLARLLHEVQYETALQLASQALSGDDVERAAQVLADLPAEDRSRPRARLLRGLIAETSGDLDRALRHYEAAMASDQPAVERAAAGQWVRVLMARHPDDWLDRAERALKKKPRLGLLIAISEAEGQDDPQRGLSWLEQWKDAFGDRPDYWYQIGLFHERAGHRDQALAAMEEVLRRNPDHADALNFLGYSLAEEGRDLDRAFSLIQRALKLRPDAGYIMDSMGWVLFQQGKAEEAIDWLERAVEREGPDPVILEHLGDAYAVTGRDNDAVRAWSTALEQVEDPEARQRLRSKLDRIQP
ncbi:MAG: tetratricopeptide repeat protein [Candidatus Dadabacteria bacterium]|nr:MAG: tetratricopeptide repeat protein [Candidatus Dadabacteria bacterium]